MQNCKETILQTTAFMSIRMKHGRSCGQHDAVNREGLGVDQFGGLIVL